MRLAGNDRAYPRGRAGDLGFGYWLCSGQAWPAPPAVKSSRSFRPHSRQQSTGIAAGPDGNLWFTETSRGNKIGRITPAGVITEFPVPHGQRALPDGIAAGPDGNLWFTESTVQPDRPDHPGRRHHRVPVPTASSAPDRITAGPDGNLWFTEHAATRSAGSRRPASITEFPIPTPAASLGHHGRARTATSGSPSTTPTRSAGSPPAGVDHRVRPSRRPAARRPGIAAGPDGNLWFTDVHGDQIGRITPAGVDHRVPDPDRRQRPCRITAGPDGNLWFTERGGNADRPDHHRPESSPSSPSRPRRSDPDRHHGRPGRQPLVHREAAQPDRPDHDRDRASPRPMLCG